MTQAEFTAWVEFYRLYPFDDMHRYYRPAAMVSATRIGITDVADLIDKRLEWLQPDPRMDGMSEADRKTMQAFGFKGQ